VAVSPFVLVVAVPVTVIEMVGWPEPGQ